MASAMGNFLVSDFIGSNLFPQGIDWGNRHALGSAKPVASRLNKRCATFQCRSARKARRLNFSGLQRLSYARFKGAEGNYFPFARIITE
jgi:hypothetical protein